MYVAVRQRSHGAWVVVDERAPDRRAIVPATVVPIGEIIELVPSFPAPLESFELARTRVLDVVGVDTMGRITLALCRIGPEAGVTQLCVARLLELAALLRRTNPFGELVRRIEVLHGCSVADLVRERLPEDVGFSADAFERRFADDVAHGRFRVVLSALAVTAELDATLDILDDPTDELVSFEPIEMASFDFGAWHVGQPHVRADVVSAGYPDEGERTEDDDAVPESGTAWSEDGNWDDVLDTLRDEEPLPFESIEAYERYAEELEKASAAETEMDDGDLFGDDPDPDEDEADAAPPEVVLSISGRRHDEDAFFEELEERAGRTVVLRARRLLELGREPARTLPAGWIASREVLSFQAGLVRERVFPPEPVVAEILRIDATGRLTLDLPLLRILLVEEAVTAFLRDLQLSNPRVRLALGPGEACASMRIDEVFDSDFDARSFCVAIRKLILGVGLVGGHGGREAA
jgi:hypothetical protein